MFGNSFCFLFLKTCFWEYKEKTIFLYFWNQKHIWLIEILKKSWRKKKENTKICYYYDLNSNAKLLNETDSLNQIHVFINFWNLETKNSILDVFNFLHKLSFENSFCYLSILVCQTSFFVWKIKNCFWKQKIKRKNSYQTYPKFFSTIIVFAPISTKKKKKNPC